MNLKKTALSFTAFLILTLCTSCTSNKMQEAEKSVFAMDTVMELSAYGKNAETALDKAEKEIKKLDATLRRGSEESEIYNVNNGGSDVSEETAELVKRALNICAQTDGTFDITIAPVMDLWGFYTKEFRVPQDYELKETLKRVNYNNVTVDGKYISLKNGAQLDLGGIAKGYLSTKIMDVMTENGVESGIVSLGGNVQTLGKKPDGKDWRVAIQDPENQDEYVGILNISDMAVVTSGGYQRFFEENGKLYHHIIDTKTGYPAENGLKSVSIICNDGTLADGLSTALYVMGYDKAMQFWKENEGFEVVFVTDEGEVIITEGLRGIFNSDKNYTVAER